MVMGRPIAQRGMRKHGRDFLPVHRTWFTKGYYIHTHNEMNVIYLLDYE